MATLLDRLFTYGHIRPDTHERQYPPPEAQRAPPIVVQIQNVADYWWSIPDLPSQPDEVLRAYPNVAPPFKAMWFEWTQPPDKDAGRLRAGVLLNTAELQPLPPNAPVNLAMFDGLWEKTRAEALSHGLSEREACGAAWMTLQSHWGQPLLALPEGTDDGTLLLKGLYAAACLVAPILDLRWQMTASLFIEAPGRPIHGPVMTTMHHVHSDGRLDTSKRETDRNMPLLFMGLPDKRFSQDEIHGMASHYIGPPFLALSLMHCKNVIVHTNEPARKLSAAHNKKHGRPLLRFHTLEIEPIKKILRNEGQIEKVGLARALHICRGHFATYTDDKPMFGKVTGTFWRPAHVRGNLSAGAVIKDYDVQRTPRDKEPV
jgi:hypothetical protein